MGQDSRDVPHRFEKAQKCTEAVCPPMPIFKAPQMKSIDGEALSLTKNL
jgi:hypothetical protein